MAVPFEPAQGRIHGPVLDVWQPHRVKPGDQFVAVGLALSQKTKQRKREHTFQELAVMGAAFDHVGNIALYLTLSSTLLSIRGVIQPGAGGPSRSTRR